ncbi:hypothetical protein [Paraburkholderia dilworthii]|uniref:hypothetical protein n=1 Tax=Paraburkholderia dilworthii TaxID=948106 RepID=UPI0004237324|nr:hypothetical protein [Paraburkholderia dilworthii]
MPGTAVYKFQYARRQGLQRTYDVVLNICRLESGVCSYAAWVHFAGAFKGNGLIFPLIAKTTEEAAVEARGRIENDIEDLTGIAE